MLVRGLLWVVSLPLLVGACGGSQDLPPRADGGAGVGGNAGAGGNAGSGGDAGNAGSGGSAGVDWSACTDTSECRLREARCCEACGPTTVADGVAVNGKYLSDLIDKLCAGQSGQCPAVDCIPTRDDIMAVCRSGRCTVIDVREDELSACTRDDDCRLRWGTACCERCSGDYGLVAVRREGFEAGACGKEPVGCPPCAPPPYPDLATPVCNRFGHCEVAYLE